MFHFMSYMGFFSLAGVIVSNTLVLVEFINNLRSTGLPLKEALSYGGVIRLRPILLTTGTTVLGLIPSIYGFGGKDHMVAPLALTFGYGLIFATVITLILIPSFYHIAEDIKCFFARILNWFGIEMDGSLFKAECSDTLPE
jgi:multidrug efflux pump subunit AcrB